MTRSTEHGRRALQNTTRQGRTAWQHQTAQGTTHTPGGGGASSENRKQAGRSRTAEEEHRTPSGSASTTAKHTPGGGGQQPQSSNQRPDSKTQKQREHTESRAGEDPKKTHQGGGRHKKPEHKTKTSRRNKKQTGGKEKRERRAGYNNWQTKRTAAEIQKKMKRRKRKGGAGRKSKRPGQGTWGRKPEKTRDNGGTAEAKERDDIEKKECKQKHKKGQPKPGGRRARQEDETAKGKVRRTKTLPGGRPAPPSQEGHRRAHTHRTQAWRPPTPKGRCRRPHETAPVQRPSTPSNDRQYGKRDASVTGYTHANHRSKRSPRPTPEGPAKDNPIAGPRTGTTRSELSATASAAASGRRNEPSSRPASTCPARPPSISGGAGPRGNEGNHGVGKAYWSTKRDRTR